VAEKNSRSCGLNNETVNFDKETITDFSGTNIRRHTMATLTCEIAGLNAFGSFDTNLLAYALLEVNKNISSVFNKTGELIWEAQVSVCDQNVVE
jgi:hypothetical protein